MYLSIAKLRSTMMFCCFKKHLITIKTHRIKRLLSCTNSSRILPTSVCVCYSNNDYPSPTKFSEKNLEHRQLLCYQTDTTWYIIIWHAIDTRYTYFCIRPFTDSIIISHDNKNSNSNLSDGLSSIKLKKNCWWRDFS